MDPIDNLAKIGCELPEASVPGGMYESVNIRADIAYIAIQFPILNGEFRYRGRLGGEVSSEQGYKAMELCALNVLAQVHHKIGFGRIIGLNHIDAYYQSVGTWDDAPYIVNGASELLVNVLENRGRHSRAIFGVERLPRNFCAGLTASFTVQTDAQVYTIA